MRLTVPPGELRVRHFIYQGYTIFVLATFFGLVGCFSIVQECEPFSTDN